MSGDKMNKKNIVPLLLQYKKYPSLWDPADRNYKNHYNREKVLKSIISCLGLDITVRQLRMRIKNLRTTYVREVNRIEESVRTGDEVRKPRLVWFDVADSFLRAVVSPRAGPEPDVNDTDSMGSETQNSEDVEAVPEHPVTASEDTAVLRPMMIEIEKDIKTEVVGEKIDEDDNLIEESLEASLGDGGEDQDTVYETTADILKAIQFVRSKKSVKDQDETVADAREDEFDTFGRHIANMLRSLPLKEAVKSQNYIHNYLSEERLKVLERVAFERD